MGALLTSLLQGVGRTGNDISQGRLAEQDRQLKMLQAKLAMQDLQQKMGIEPQRLAMEQQNARRAQEEFEWRKKSGDLIQFSNGRIWSVSQGKFIDAPNDQNQAIKDFIAKQPPERQKALSDRAQVEMAANPGNPQAALKEVMSYNDKLDSDARGEEKWKREQAEREKAAKEARQENAALRKTIIDFALQDKQKYMTPQERQIYDAIKTAEPMADRLVKFLEDNKLQDEGGFVFGNRSALMQHLRFLAYKKGVTPEAISSELIKDSAALQIMGARPWMTMGRGKYMFETISQHLPQPTDTPKLLYDKVTWLRDNVLNDAKESLAGYVQPGGAGVSDPLNLLAPSGVKP